jgi:Txe/YoeB family toxin of Txe-Axe toxin-antitoxin module
MSISDDFEHIDKFSCEYKSYVDIDELLSEYDYDFKDWNENIRTHCDIYMWMLRLLQTSPCVRPISIYVSLLENGYKDNDESRSTREKCIRTLVKLKRQRLLKWELEEDGIVTDYTKFEPVKGDHFDYFSRRMDEISTKRVNFRCGDTRLEVEDITAQNA